MSRLLILLGLSYFCAVALGASAQTQAFYEQTQYSPLLTYECYRTDVTIEPEGSVNFTALWDGTKSNDDTAAASFWYAPNGTQDQYQKGLANLQYDEQSGTLKISDGSFNEEFVVLTPPFNGLAYYLEFKETSDRNQTVEKIFDVDSRCGNAAAFRKVVDPDGEKGFYFSRDVPEPTESCVQVLLCTEQEEDGQ